jgi:valyl-tRNA synthetase
MVIKQEEIEQSVGICWRCKTPAEFIQAEQWFLKLMPLKEKVLGVADSINWHPEYMQLRLDEWVKSLKWDWVISRQRYFATPIPLWECKTCDAVVLAEKEQCYVDPTIDQPPVNICPECGGSLKGSEDVFDTWMDSSVTPLYNTFWERDQRLFKCMYPMSLRPQAHDIIRTWAFYTILRCLLITGQKPFDEIMMGGFILAPDGKPMHTSLGNVIDPLEILQKDGADPLRYYAAKCKLGEDNPFRPKDLVRGKRLMKKLWSVQRFVGMILDKNEDFNPHQPLRDNVLDIMDLWILTRYSKTVARCTDYLDQFAYAEAIREAEQFLWHEVADHYIEMVKHRVYDQFDEQAITVLYTLGLGILKLLAPFLPHITEELFQSSYQPYEKEISLHTTPWPRPVLEDHAGEQAGELIKNIISVIRDWKSSQGMPLNAPIEAVTIIAHKEMDGLNRGSDTISQTLNIHKLSFSDKLPTTVREVINVEPIHATIGPQFKNYSPAVINELLHHPNEIAAALTDKSEYSFTHNNEIITITPEHVNIVKHHKGDKTAIINMENIIIAVEA